MNKAILIAPVIVLLYVVPTFAAAQQTLDQQEHCGMSGYPSCYRMGFAAGQLNTGNCPYVAPGTNANFYNYCLGFHMAQIQGQNNTGQSTFSSFVKTLPPH